MRYAIAVVFAVVATMSLFTIPFWVTGTSANAFMPSIDRTPIDRMIADLRTHNYTDARSLIAVSPTPPSDAQLDQMAAMIPKTGQATANVTHWSYISGASGTQTGLEIYYDYGARGATYTQATMVDENGKHKIQSIYVRYLSPAALHQTDFRLPDSWRSIRWVYVAIAMAFDAFAFFTFVMCLSDGRIRWRWRWLWALLTVTGFIRYNFDWLRLVSQLQPVAFMFPPAQFVRFSMYGSWVLSITAPLGAALYWARTRTWRGTAA